MKKLTSNYYSWWPTPTHPDRKGWKLYLEEYAKIESGLMWIMLSIALTMAFGYALCVSAYLGSMR